MTNAEFLKKNKVNQMNQSEAIVFAAKLISDSFDRQTELQKKNIEVQIQMAGIAGEMFDKMKQQLNNPDEGDEWKNKNEDTAY